MTTFRRRIARRFVAEVTYARPEAATRHSSEACLLKPGWHDLHPSQEFALMLRAHRERSGTDRRANRAPLNVSADRIAESFKSLENRSLPSSCPRDSEMSWWYSRDIDTRRRSDVTRRCLREIRFVLRAGDAPLANIGRTCECPLASSPIPRCAQVSVVSWKSF